jgi:crossover junction endodeoxyribonuclease RuvC
MRILGIDPGITNLGYSVVDAEEEMRVVDCGVLNFPPRIPIGLSEIIVKHRPDEVAIEEPFIGRNVKSAFDIGRAQALAILAAANRGLPISYYSPAQVKQQVTGYGRSDKQQVLEMVKIQLGLPQLSQPSDAVDALAVAICHIQQSRLNRWLAKQIPK